MLLTGLIARPNSLRADSLWALWRHHQDPVVVSSTATDDYTQRKFGSGTAKPESYLFFQGKFYGGVIRDADMEHEQFRQIAQILGRDLVHQNYFPSKDVKNADLLIVVHWGTTEVYQNDYAASMSLPNNGKGSTPMGTMGVLEKEDQQISFEENAHLLGYGQQLSRQQYQTTVSSVSNDEWNLIQGLDEERYFVILMAYDYHTMKQGTRPKLLWSTRFSMPGPGNKFTVALPVMSRVAADYFGHADGVKNIPVDKVPRGRVDVGEPTVVGNGK